MTLESTNRLLGDLERQLSISLNSSNQTHQSHGSVVVDPAMAGLAKQSVQSSVLQYIKESDGGFDANQVYADRVTRFPRAYSPDHASGDNASPDNNNIKSSDIDNDSASEYSGSDYGYDYYENVDNFDDNDDDYDYDFDEDPDDLLLPPSPPRSPPREMDPSKLYGLYDFSGPDPLHCTLLRDEPVYLINDQDNYWWLIKKLSKAERVELASASNPADRAFSYISHSDNEDGKIGFVPAECLETYVERLARLNCFKNEELEKSSRDDLPLSSESVVLPTAPEESLPVLGRKGSILKKTGLLRLHNKLVTFENLRRVNLDDSSDSEPFRLTDECYNVSHEDIHRDNSDHELVDDRSSENHSEVISDVYPAEMPLLINKSSRKNPSPSILAPGEPQKFAPPPHHTEETESIGSFLPDTPDPSHFSPNQFLHTHNQGDLRRSLVMDRFSLVFPDDEHDDDPTFDVYSGYDEDHDLARSDSEENVTPLTSMNSLSNIALPPRALEKKKSRPTYDAYLPILGKLDELTEKLAELEHSL